jgi:hypothetical protein
VTRLAGTNVSVVSASVSRSSIATQAVVGPWATDGFEFGLKVAVVIVSILAPAPVETGRKVSL